MFIQNFSLWENAWPRSQLPESCQSGITLRVYRRVPPEARPQQASTGPSRSQVACSAQGRLKGAGRCSCCLSLRHCNIESLSHTQARHPAACFPVPANISLKKLILERNNQGQVQYPPSRHINPLKSKTPELWQLTPHWNAIADLGFL